MDPATGLPAGTRFRCGVCGNLTRFDIESVERVRRFWHVDLAGRGRMESEERVDVSVERVECRWCALPDSVEVVQAPRVDAQHSPEEAPDVPGGARVGP